MLRRVGAATLWIGPLAFIPLAALYHAVGFSAGLVGGMVQLALVAAGIHSKLSLKHRDDAPGLLLGTTLLVIGGAEMWATGASGPPDPANLSVAHFNSAGLTLGFFITLLGLAATVAALSSSWERAAGAVAVSSFTLMVVIWVLGVSLRTAVYRSPLINLPPAQMPQGLGILREFIAFSGIAIAIGGYLSGAVIAEVATRAGWVRRRAGLLMSIYCLIGILAFPFSQSLVSGNSISDIPWLAWLMIPWLPPAMMCLVPYYVGVLGLVQRTERQPSSLASEAAFSRSL
jgi:hypothetical protein